MGISYNTSTIVDGLVLGIDIANQRSYPRSGNTITDFLKPLSKYTIAGTANFNAGSGGNLVFDGSTNYVNFTAPNLGTTTTVEMWAALGAGYSGKMPFGWFRYDVYCASGGMGFNTGNSDMYGINSTTVSNLGLVGNPRHYVFEMRSDVSYINNKMYINSVSQTLSQQLGTELAGQRNFNSGVGRISAWTDTAGYDMPMSWAIFKIYNRALTQAEINTNFNALRGRFGV
jgi:hypothetical protein